MRTLSQVLNDAACQAESMRNEIVRMEGDLNILYKQRDALKEALEELINICDNAGGPEWEGWSWVRDGMERGQAILAAIKEKP